MRWGAQTGEVGAQTGEVGAQTGEVGAQTGEVGAQTGEVGGTDRWDGRHTCTDCVWPWSMLFLSHCTHSLIRKGGSFKKSGGQARKVKTGSSGQKVGDRASRSYICAIPFIMGHVGCVMSCWAAVCGGHSGVQIF